MTVVLDRLAVATAVKRVLINESRLRMDPADLPDDEPLTGDRLQVTSLAFIGVLIDLEAELDIELSDDLFAGRTFVVVDDVIEAVMGSAR